MPPRRRKLPMRLLVSMSQASPLPLNKETISSFFNAAWSTSFLANRFIIHYEKMALIAIRKVYTNMIEDIEQRNGQET